MCGIAGYSSRKNSRTNYHWLSSTTLILRHRGPDDNGAFNNISDGIGLAQTRLSIIDASSLGHQPMVSPDNQVVLVFNGEIFNFKELRQDLESAGYLFKGHSDTEVLLNLYCAHGERMLQMLNGMFAVAIWDARRKALLLARDDMGVKPLYWAKTGEAIVFASEIKALLSFPGLRRDLDAAALRDHLTYLWAPAPRTMLKDVKKLEPGCAMWVKAGQVERHFRWADTPACSPIQDISDEEAIDQVRSALHQAVQRQLVSDVPIGAFLSGGLDSSAVAAFAQRAAPGSRLQCFTIGMDAASMRREGLVADLPYARQVAAHLGVDLHEVQATPAMADELPRMIWHLDEPQADPAPLNVLAISRLARQQGIKVLLSGAGGDDIFTGYRRHRLLQLELAGYGRLPQMARSAIAAAARHLPTDNLFFRRLRKGLGQTHLSGDQRIASLFEWLEPEWVDKVLSPDMLHQSRHPNPLVEALAELPASVPGLNRMLHLECRHFLADHNLNYTDKMSMAAGVEVRVPLLDRDLVRLAFSLPLRVKQRGRQGKWVLSQAVRNMVPASILNRPKTGFALPLRAWLHGPLNALMQDTLSPQALHRRGIFNPQGVQQLIKADAQGHVDGAYPLLALICTELWCRAFIDESEQPALH